MRHVTFVPAVALRYSVSMICRGRRPRQSHVGKEFAEAGKRDRESNTVHRFAEMDEEDEVREQKWAPFAS